MVLTEQERADLIAEIPSDTYDGSVASRARIVLMADEGKSAADIAAAMQTSKVTVYKWLKRYAVGGMQALGSRKSTGRPRVVTPEQRARILALTKQTPPAHTGLSHWSSAEMAKYLRKHEGIEVSHNFVATLWREHDIQPHRQGTFKLSRDPQFAAKVMDIVGLYLDPPAGAVVLSADEKTQIQALDRTQPLLPITFAKTEQRTHDYVRHGTTNLFAALNIGSGAVTGRCFSRRRTSEFLAFMDQVAAEYSGQQIHVVLDNLSTHSGEDVDRWLARHSNVTFHFTPVGSSWINQVEIWFGNITRQSIRRSTHTSVKMLINSITAYISSWNEDAKPFKWVATAEEIIQKVAVLERDFKKLLANNTK